MLSCGSGEEVQVWWPDLSPETEEGERLGGASLFQGLGITAICLLIKGIIFEPSSDLVTFFFFFYIYLF